MGLRLTSSKSKNAESFYFVQDYRDPQTKKRTTKIFEKLGTLSSLQTAYGVSSREEVIHILQNILDQRRIELEQQDQTIVLRYSLNELLPLDQRNTFNVSWLYIQKIFSMLRLDEICQSVVINSKISFSLSDILSILVSTRILFPGSKRSSLEDSTKLLFAPEINLSHIYRALPILADNRYKIESALYQNSQKIIKRETDLLYYDCTNFYFETEDEDDYRKYGHSKENRPNPIIQYGLFLDSSHIPVADICFPGNNHEVNSMPELEEILTKNFNIKRFIVCADSALNSFENKIYNDRRWNGAFIVTQSVKKLNKTLREWAIDPTGWKLLNQEGTWNIRNLKETILINGKVVPTDSLTFYKDRWIRTTKKSERSQKKETLDEHLIISFNTKFKKYQQRIREKKLERAEKLLNNPGKIDTKDQRNPRYYIKKTVYDKKSGEIAQETSYEINYEKAEEDARFDGFYAVTTDLRDEDIGQVIDINQGRWEIEECFEIMKSELETRPIFVRTKKSIEGHLLICFIALTVYRILEQYLEKKYTCFEIFEMLRDMWIVYDQGPYYKAAFMRTELTDKLAEIFGYQFGYKILEEKKLKKFYRNANSKNITHFIEKERNRL